MAIAATRTNEFTVGSLIRQAHVDAGLLNVNQSCSAAQTQDGMDKLERMSKSSAVHGFMARVTDFHTITLEEGTQTYEFPAYVLDLTGTAMYTDPQSTGAETPVSMVMREQWATLTQKNSTDSSPSIFYVSKPSVPLAVKVWAVPGAAQDGGTISFQALMYRADIRSAGVTPDYEVYWQDWLVAELAARLALSNSLSIDRYTALQGKANQLLKEAKAMGRQRGPQQFRMGHRSPWLGR